MLGFLMYKGDRSGNDAPAVTSPLSFPVLLLLLYDPFGCIYHEALLPKRTCQRDRLHPNAALLPCSYYTKDPSLYKDNSQLPAGATVYYFLSYLEVSISPRCEGMSRQIAPSQRLVIKHVPLSTAESPSFGAPAKKERQRQMVWSTRQIQENRDGDAAPDLGMRYQSAIRPSPQTLTERNMPQTILLFF